MFCIYIVSVSVYPLQDESYICCNAGKGLMPKKLRPAVDLMAFKCRTLKVNSAEHVHVQYLVCTVASLDTQLIYSDLSCTAVHVEWADICVA
jgi:hypothetical protein